jgi:hypothetical protein
MDALLQDVIDSAERAVATMQGTARLLDYSTESLGTVEQMLAEAAPHSRTLPDDTVTALVQQLGSYVLEVGRRQFGGKYYWNEVEQQPVLVVGEPESHIAMMSWGRIRGRLGGDAGDNIPFFFEGFAQRAANPTVGARVLFT